ncbi:c-type cytochrome [Pacificoceanicola onchidii]|uniref:c-type cytochrome n=1 Tax=Pacificoceanicola onchidii TaxID=2562685 RepID=UPI003B832BCA
MRATVLDVTPDEEGAAPAAEETATASATTGEGLVFALGRMAHAEELAAWDVDVLPDGTGLPDGSGNAFDGEGIFEDNCASCHGSFAEGVDNWPKLAGGEGSLADEDPLKTVGSYWPYLSTVWDYVHRSMPFGNAQSLSADETYAIVAYILYSNDMIDDDFELSRETWGEVEMLNAGGFIVDDREATEYSQWRGEPCMENCKDGTVEVTMRATVLDVTPDEEGTEAAEAAPEEQVAQVTETAPAAETVAEEPAAAGGLDPELVAAGEKVFKKCKSCHKVDGGKGTGPYLNGVWGRAIGGVEGFKYSGAMAEHGGVWDEETMSAFLTKPKAYIKGTRMSFAGLRKQGDIDAVNAYLQSISQ